MQMILSILSLNFTFHEVFRRRFSKWLEFWQTLGIIIKRVDPESVPMPRAIRKDIIRSYSDLLRNRTVRKHRGDAHEQRQTKRRPMTQAVIGFLKNNTTKRPKFLTLPPRRFVVVLYRVEVVSEVLREEGNGRVWLLIRIRVYVLNTPNDACQRWSRLYRHSNSLP